MNTWYPFGVSEVDCFPNLAWYGNGVMYQRWSGQYHISRNIGDIDIKIATDVKTI
jgi:hypothetical protein